MSDRIFASTRLRLIAIAILALLAPAARPLVAQGIGDFTEFYRLMQFNAVEQLQFCYPTSTPVQEPFVVGVRRDAEGRPTLVARFRFGNPDNRSDWSSMHIEYRRYDSLNIVQVRRTWFDAGGTPLVLLRAAAEEVLYRPDGQLLMRKLVDPARKPVDDSTGVHRAMFRFDSTNTYLEDWYISTGKTRFGEDSDGPFRPFSRMQRQTYFRRFTVDAHGNLLREELRDFNRRPLPFPDGALAHTYELNDCAQPVKVSLIGTDGAPMADRRGVAFITYAYDDAGRVIEERTYDLDGKLKGVEPDGAAIIRYTFRAFDGVLVGTARLDDDEQPVK